MRKILNLVVILSLVTVGVFGVWTSASAFFFGEVNATGNWTAAFTWTIDKSVTPDTWDLCPGDSGTSQYTISVVKEPVSEAAWIEGVVHIKNTITNPSAPTEGLAIVVNVYDGVLPGGVLIGTINVDVSGNPILDTDEDGYYPYHLDIPSASIHASGTYTVEAVYTITNFPGHPGEEYPHYAYATATLPASPVSTNGTINVDDTNGGSWAFSDSGSVSYRKTFTCDDEGINLNRATIRETGQYNDASVTVNCVPCELVCRITGGGTIGTGREPRVTHGFELHCNVDQLPNRLEVNWGGNQFHLETLTEVECSDDPAIDPRPPRAGCDTYHGWGVGRYNGVDGYQAEWIFTDAGERGNKDWAWIKITDAGGDTVMEVWGFLRFGNQQFHNCTGQDAL